MHLGVPRPLTVLRVGLFSVHVVLLVDHDLLWVDR